MAARTSNTDAELSVPTAPNRGNDRQLDPMVSVVMPVRNEEHYIERSLSSVLAQDYPRDRMEVVVADGMSSDRTRRLVRRFQDAHANLRCIDNPGRIVASGLNAAMAIAGGDIIIRVDGHSEIHPGYVRRCVGHLQRAGIVGVGGPITTVGETPVAHAIAVAMSSRFGVGDSPFRTVTPRARLVDTVAFPAYRRTAMIHAGPFDEELVRNQDDEYNYRLRKLGGKILLAPDVRSRYYSRSSLVSLARQYFQYGFWKVRVAQKHPRQMRPRQFVPAAFVAALVASLLLLMTSLAALGWWILGGLIVVYLTASVVAALFVGEQERWSTRTLLPTVFYILHLSYGLGFLTGLAAFWNRWNLTVRSRHNQSGSNDNDHR